MKMNISPSFHSQLITFLEAYYLPPEAPTDIYSGRKSALNNVPPIAGNINSNAAARKP